MRRRRSIVVGTMLMCLICGVSWGQSSYGLDVDFYIGWQGGQRQTLSLASDGPYPGALFRSVKMEIPNRGIWLGGGATATLGCDLKLFVQGWYFLPNKTEGAILLDPGATPRLIPASISSNMDWWYADVFGTYRLNGPFSAVLGVRCDHHNFFTEDPEILNIIFSPLTNRMRFDLNMVSTIPYFGFQWGPSNGITLRAVYSPLASVTAQSTLSQNNSIFRPQNWLGGKSGLTKKEFVELFGEYSGQVGSLQLGLFARGTWLSGSTDTTLNESLVNGSASYNVSYRRAAWTIGATAAVGFDVPSFLYGW